MNFKAKNRIYMDYAAAAPETRVAARAYARAAKNFANPSSIHASGTLAKRILEEARTECARALFAHPDEIIFTGSGTESDNLAIMGVFKHPVLSSRHLVLGKPHIITTAIEHPAILEACRHLEEVGAEVTYLSVNQKGIIDVKELRAALRPETILVSITYANSEIGVVQPIKEIAKEIRHYKKSKVESLKSKVIQYPLFHTDACQAAQYLNMNVEQLGVDMLTMNGTKLGGPHGIGLLYIKRGTPIVPLVYGGGQERGLRSGTENVPAARALGAAFCEAQEIQEKEIARLIRIQNYFFENLKKSFPEARINGSEHERLPNNAHVSFPNIQSELLVLELDARNISASAGSACASAKDKSSHVMEALYGAEDGKKWGSVRFSFGRGTQKSDVEKVLRALGDIHKKYTSILARPV